VGLEWNAEYDRALDEQLARDKEAADRWHQDQLEAEDMRQFIIDGGLWTLFDDEAMDITARLLSTGRV
jgi:hypothetical protein